MGGPAFRLPSGVLDAAFRRFLLAGLERPERPSEDFAAIPGSGRREGSSMYAALAHRRQARLGSPFDARGRPAPG